MASKLTAQQRLPLIRQAKAMAAREMTQREIAVRLGVSQPTVCGWLRKRPVQQQVADKIRAELVCCDIYERFEPLGSEAGTNVAVLHHDHLPCFYGEWAARIAEQVNQ